MATVKKNPLLILVAFLLPLVFLGVVLVVSVIPSASLTTDYDFLYATCSDGSRAYSYNCRGYLVNRYRIDNGRLMEQPVPADLDSDQDAVPDILENPRARLFIHDTQTNQSREISQQQAGQLELLDLLTSPDGVAVEWDRSGGSDFFFVFGSRSTYGYYLTKGTARQRLELINDSNRYYNGNDLLFLGWIQNP
ncbi:MAG: hypothetical protein R3F50_10465 [Gammaproteobacteria bacterium]|jgi:hypothetical protein